jgi:hypothetical protein
MDLLLRVRESATPAGVGFWFLISIPVAALEDSLTTGYRLESPAGL